DHREPGQVDPRGGKEQLRQPDAVEWHGKDPPKKTVMVLLYGWKPPLYSSILHGTYDRIDIFAWYSTAALCRRATRHRFPANKICKNAIPPVIFRQSPQIIWDILGKQGRHHENGQAKDKEGCAAAAGTRGGVGAAALERGPSAT